MSSHGTLALFLVLWPVPTSSEGEDSATQRVKNLTILILVVCLMNMWFLYLTYGNTRFLGWITTRLVNWYMDTKKKGIFLRVGSLSPSLLAGKVAFKDVVFADRDVVIKIYDGFVMFRYWSMHYKTSENKHHPSRLLVQLNGLKYHVYNHTAAYDWLRDYLKQDSGFPSQSVPLEPQPLPAWMRFMPYIRIRINTGGFFVQNHSLPATLSIVCKRANLHYAYLTGDGHVQSVLSTQTPTGEAVSKIVHCKRDVYTWFVTGKVSNVKV